MIAPETFLSGKVTLYGGDCLAVLPTLPPDSIDAGVSDPPYGLDFMGKGWDRGVPGVAYWRAVYRVLKPGAHLVAFCGSRTYHRLAVAIEDAGFEIRDMIAWLYGSGFPKSPNVAKVIDKHLGVAGTYGGPKSEAHAAWIDRGVMRGDDGHEGYQRPWMDDADAVDRAARIYLPGSAEAQRWNGFATALKPALEPIVLARKPLVGTVAENVIEHGVGALNIDACRIETGGELVQASAGPVGGYGGSAGKYELGTGAVRRTGGRWPANVAHDGSDEVVASFPDVAKSSNHQSVRRSALGRMNDDGWQPTDTTRNGFCDSGSAARFFYTAKADADDRIGSKHPTVKPRDLMRWLARLVTPPGGVLLDPFAGTGTTGEAGYREGFRSILIEKEPDYLQDIRRRMALVLASPEQRVRESLKAGGKVKPADDLPLFGGEA